MVSRKFAVIDATADKTEHRFRGLAAKYVDWELRQHGAVLVENPSDADILCVTVVSPHEYLCLPRALRRVGVQPLAAKRQRIKVVLGGQGALSPAVFDPFIDVACVGEGQAFLGKLVASGIEGVMQLPNAWVPGKSNIVVPDKDFPWNSPPVMAEDGIVRIYASRGCKKKCLFCHTGWATGYRENDEQLLMEQYRRVVSAGYKVNVVTNDAPALSFFNSIPQMEHFSASYSQTRELIASGDISKIAGKVKSVRFGVEAPSYRIRKIIGKPIDTFDLLRVSCDLLNAGVGVRWFMIAGLPGETDADWDELREAVVLARHKVKKGALQLSFTAFCPDPAAPLCVLPLDDTYYDRFRSFWSWFFDGGGFTKRIQLFRCAGPSSRLEHAKASMSATEDELRRGWFDNDNPNWRVQYNKPPDEMRRIAMIYAKRVGLAITS